MYIHINRGKKNKVTTGRNKEKQARVEALTLRVRMGLSVRLAGSRRFHSRGKKMRPLVFLPRCGPIPSFSEVVEVQSLHRIGIGTCMI